MPSPCLSVTGSQFFSFLLKLFATLQLIAGVAFIALPQQSHPSDEPLILYVYLVFGSVSFSGYYSIVHNLFQSYTRRLFWVLGFLSIFTAIIGFIASSPKAIRCCIGFFLIFSGRLLVGQGGFVLYLFVAPEKAINTITSYQTTDSAKDKIDDAVYIGRWVLLGLVAAEMIACITALCLRCCVYRVDKYEKFVDEKQEYDVHKQRVDQQMAQLKLKVAQQQQQYSGDDSFHYTTGTTGIKAISLSPTPSRQYDPKTNAGYNGQFLKPYLSRHAMSAPLQHASTTPLIVPSPIVKH